MFQDSPLFAQLTQRSEGYSPNQRTLARYILDNYQGVAFANVRQLAQQAGVSEATVVRFAKALEFSGYPALQREIRRVVRADLEGTERFRLSETTVQPAPAESGDGPLAAAIRKELENIAGLRQSLDHRAFRQAAQALRRAPEVVIAGTRATATLAQHLWFGLNKLDVRATRFLSITTETYDRLEAMDRKALVVAIGFPRYLKELVDLLIFAKRAGFRTLTVTDSPFSPLRGDIALYSPAESASFIAFHCAPLILLNALLQEVSLLDKQRTLKALKRFEALAGRAGYFYKS